MAVCLAFAFDTFVEFLDVNSRRLGSHTMTLLVNRFAPVSNQIVDAIFRGDARILSRVLSAKQQLPESLETSLSFPA